MSNDQVVWAGVPFLPVFHHDGRFFRCPGLFAFVHSAASDRTLLFVGESDNIASEVESHPCWGEALKLGFNELDICTKAAERLDRLILTAHIVKRCTPLLNLLEEQAGSARSSAVDVRRRA